MPRCPFKGEVVWNNKLQRNMHVVATYDSGEKAVYSDLLHEFGKILRKNLREDDQNIVGVIGQPGSGKSTIAMNIARLIDPNWSLESGYVYDFEDFKEKLAENSTNQVFLFDEASLVVNAKDAMKNDSKLMIGMLDTCRSRHNSIIFVLPGFEDLNKAIRERLCQYRVYCASRKEHIVPGYSGRGFFKLYFAKQGEFSSTYWNLVGTGIFKDISDQDKAEYTRVKKMHQDKFVDRITSEGAE